MSDAITITLNGRPRALPSGTTVHALLELLALAGRRAAVEINGEIVPRSGYLTHAVLPGDRIEIVDAIGGG